MSDELVTINANIGALSNTTRPIFKVPTNLGGLTIIGGMCVQAGAGTTQLYIVEMDANGTAIGGTLGSFGTVYATNVPNAASLTASRCFVDAGNYIGIKENNVGAANAVTLVSLTAIMGKAEAA